MEIPRTRRSVRVRRREPADVADIALLRGIADGSEAAFEALWRRYGAAVHGVCRGILRDPEAAEDATQEAFARVWRSAGTVDPRRGEPVAWLMTVARNAALNVARITHAEPIGEVPGAADDARDQETVDRLWLHGALTRLPEAERAALELAYLADLSHSQVAARLDAPLGTVKARIRRGLARLTDMAEER